MHSICIILFNFKKKPMSTNKNAFTRYKILDQCFRHSSQIYDIETLLDTCNAELKNRDECSKGIKKRQLYDDISFMKSEFAAPIKNNKVKGYFYSDSDFSIFSANNILTNEEITNLLADTYKLSKIIGLEQLQLLNNFDQYLDKFSNRNTEDFPKLNFVSVGNNKYLRGVEHFKTLYNHIFKKEVLHIIYRTFEGLRKEHEIHPYYLKQYKNRWFLIGQNPNFESPTILALDRITSISAFRDKDYIESDIDFEEYFDDVIGVTIPENIQVEKIEIYVVDRKTKGYIETKPLHGSQTPLRKFKDGYKFSIKVIPNYELESLILSFGEKIKILSPDSLQKRVKNRLQKSIKHYE